MKWFQKKCCESSVDPAVSSTTKTLKVGLIGNPNSGKTTLFNALTGACQRVGNWPGVTVERKTGSFREQDTRVEVIDLPGIYSFTAPHDNPALDERIACEFILNREVDFILNVVDASNLERHLYLTLQLIETGVPVVIALNMMDVAHRRGLKIQIAELAKRLGCIVIPIVARQGQGIDELKKVIVSIQQNAPHKPFDAFYPELIQTAKASLGGDYAAIRSLEGDALNDQVAHWQQQIKTQLHEDADILIADARYRTIQSITEHCVIRFSEPVSTWTARLDSLILNCFLGLPIFLLVMYSLFFFAINVGGAFQDFFDITSNTIFVEGLAQGLTLLHVPNALIALLANGIGKGINTVVTFIPVIATMFLGLAFLEDSGYMARAAFLIDRLMRFLGLPGKSFVPMIVGFGCNVPAVMAARTLENPRDRILTVMMTPFMSCSARLTIYAVFTAAFFKSGGQNIVFALYLLGMVMAVFTGWLLRKTILQGEPAPLLMELPPYHWPRLSILLRLMWQRLSGFVWRAGKLILPICIILGVLNSLTMTGSLTTGEGDVHSILSQLGQWLTPIFSPMGIQASNWPATVGLVTGVLAKEVVVGTLNSLYSQVGHLSALTGDTFHFFANLKAALISIPVNLSQLGDSLTHPVVAKAPVHSFNQPVYGVMADYFDSTASVIAYLLFVLLYFPCVSTIAVMWRELNRNWALFSVFWTTGLAYGVAVGFYQLATFVQHPVFSGTCLGILATLFLSVFFMLRQWRPYEFASR